MLVTLFLSQGVPMLLAGDEWGRSQGGNNNAYCQDNEISWLDWQKADQQLLSFTKQLIHFCKNHPSFQRRRWFQDMPVTGTELKDIMWFLPDGQSFPQQMWDESDAGPFGVFLNGSGIRCVNMDGQRLSDDHFYIVFNPGADPVDFKMPADECADRWQVVINTQKGFVEADDERISESSMLTVQGRSLLLLRCPLESK